MGANPNKLIQFLETHESKIIPVVIYTIGLVLAVDTFLELLYSVLDYKAYQFMFQWLPPQMIFLRYCNSVIWRCLFIIVSAGVCLRRDIFRKFLIASAWVEIMIVSFKHPYQSIVNADIYTHSHLSYFTKTIHFPWSQQQYYLDIIIVMIGLCAADWLKAYLVIFIFSLPEVRKYFK